MSDDGTRGRRGDRQRPPARERSAQHRSEQRPSERARRTDPARLTAYTAMREVADGAYANLALPSLLRDKGLSGRDAGFATELVYGAIRMSGLYDAIIASAAARPVDRIDGNVLDTLRLGAHQVLGMRVATHAAVDETVALARQVNGAGAAGFVNAVMRRISEREPAAWVELVSQGITDPVERLGAAHLAPRVGGQGSARCPPRPRRCDSPTRSRRRLAALLAVDNEPAKVALVARPGLASLDELEDFGAERTGLSPVGAVLPEGDPGAVDAVRDGRAAVQDEGSQLLVLALAAADVEGERRRPRALAGPVRRPGRQGGAARRTRHPATNPLRGQRDQ